MSEYNWISGYPADVLADKLEDCLEDDSLDFIRKTVFHLHMGTPHDPTLFMLSDSLNGKVTINAYANIRDGIVELCKKLRAMKK
jgi:hypothetical protein